MEKLLKKVRNSLFTNSSVTRFAAHSVTYGMDMLIDINTDIYPLLENDKFTLALASTLYKDNRPDPGVYKDYSKEVFCVSKAMIVQKTLMDDYEYCMYGKVFKYQYKDDGKMQSVFIYVHYQFDLHFLWWSFNES